MITTTACMGICVSDASTYILLVTGSREFVVTNFGHSTVVLSSFLHAASTPIQSLAVMLQLTSSCVAQGEQERGAYAD